ncbi:MAG: membrane protein insertion efficiency factor YidD [Christensenellales bacterium]|jgi:putative membrane protein insertion efficiency factor
MRRLALSLIALYRRYVSPIKPATCRFYPTCSSYAYQAVARFGAVKGGLLALRRILRCHPLHDGAYYDPVPDIYPHRCKRRRKAR